MIHEKHSGSAELESIGRRIREIRVRRGMTQTELAGNDITRNMLSRIENGAALPSLPTLCSIAERLGVPAGALLGDLGDYAGWQASKELEALLKAKKYEKLIDICSSADRRDLGKPVYEILCRAHIEYAHRLYLEGKLTRASEQLDAAEAVNIMKLKDLPLYREQIFIKKELIAVCPARKKDEQSEESAELSDKCASIIFNNDDAVYLYCISKLSGISGVAYSMPHERAEELRRELTVLTDPIVSKLYKTHIDAKLHMVSAEYLDAKAKLLTLLTPEPPLPVLYDIYADLEFCCKCCGDFENAYKFSGMRLDLIQRIE